LIKQTPPFKFQIWIPDGIMPHRAENISPALLKMPACISNILAKPWPKHKKNYKKHDLDDYRQN
ncbi:MAG: hypothetical protein C0P72_009700, partial [Clostridia bacterium]